MRLRKKPRRVRERYILASMVVLAPVLLVVWFLTYHYDASTSGTDFFKSISSSVVTSFNNPVYQTTFGSASPKKAVNPSVSDTATTTVGTAASTPATP